MHAPLRPPPRLVDGGALSPAGPTSWPRTASPDPLDTPGAPGAPGGDPDPVFDLAHGRELLGFAARSVRRHRRLAGALLAGVFAVSALAAAIMPRTYDVSTKIVAQKNAVMPSLGNPRRPALAESDAPTRLASEAVLRRDNLVQIIRATNLLAIWPTVQSPAGRLKERVLGLLTGPMTEEERMDALVGLLRSRLRASAGDGTVTIGLSWMEPTSAFRIVQTAQQNFIEERHASEVSMIGESIAIIEEHLAAAEGAIERARAAVDDARGRTPGRRQAAGARAAAGSQEAASLAAVLSAKRQAIGDLESARSRRIAELQTRLAELRHVYGASHPEIATTQQSIQALAEDSPPLIALRGEVRQLEAQLAQVGGRAGSPGAAAAALDRAGAPSDTVEDPRITYAKSRLKIALADYEELLDRREAARIELETARAAFKYRYGVVTPPEIPKRASRPRVLAMLLGGLMLGAALALFAAVALDLAGGRVLEAWQVERRLGIPTLAVVRRA